MASLERIKNAIRDIADRPKNVTVDEIEWVINQLGQFYRVSSRTARHGKLFTVSNCRFMVCLHNPGSKQVKSCYVGVFIDAMTELGLYEE